MMNKRRFLRIAASASVLAAPWAMASSALGSMPLRRWRGLALGAGASITFAHPDADILIERVRAEIDRLENVFSLYRPDSALSRLNRTGRLEAPPFDLLTLLSLCDTVHRRTNGAFDPTIQPLWRLYADRYSSRTPPDDREIEQALRLVGWDKVLVSPKAVELKNEGARLTLNGVAQGYIADKIADFLRGEGLSNVLIDMGEIQALGYRPNGAAWTVGLLEPGSPGKVREYIKLTDKALATSEPLGTTFDDAKTVGHILDPRTGRPAGRWRQVSVTAESAALADGLSTAFTVMASKDIEKVEHELGVSANIVN